MRNSVVSYGIALALLGSALVAYAFWYAQVAHVVSSVRVQAPVLLAKEQEVREVARAKDALVALTQEEAAVSAYLVEERDIVTFLSALERSGDALGSVVEVVSVTTEMAGEQERMLLSLKVTGSFDAVLRTLGTIEYGPYESITQNITFDMIRGSESEAVGQWALTALYSIGMRSDSTGTQEANASSL